MLFTFDFLKLSGVLCQIIWSLLMYTINRTHIYTFGTTYVTNPILISLSFLSSFDEHMPKVKHYHVTHHQMVICHLFICHVGFHHQKKKI